MQVDLKMHFNIERKKEYLKKNVTFKFEMIFSALQAISFYLDFVYLNFLNKTIITVHRSFVKMSLIYEEVI